MQTATDWPVGVCTWSLQADVAAVGDALRSLQLEHVHLAIGPALAEDGDAYLEAVRAQSWTVTSTMIGFPEEDYSTLEAIKLTGGIRPDDTWERNRRDFARAAAITARLGVRYLSFHAGFIDHEDAAYAAKFYERIRVLADTAAAVDVMLLMETGQESAAELRTFLETLDHPAVAINFDPANMILYDKDEPLEAVRILAPWIRHVHVKDACRTTTPGEWGSEVPWGEGEVGAERFLDVLAEVGFKGALAIEREAGGDRVGDIRTAVNRLQGWRRD